MMTNTAFLLFQFLMAAAVVVLAGSYLARFGDAIGDRTGIGGLWIGTVVVAAATSLPELATDIAAVRIGAIDLAVGDLFGSSMANMLILALLDLGYPTLRILREAANDNLLSAALAIVLTSIAVIALLLHSPMAVFGMGVGSLVIAAVYLAGSRAIYLRSSVREPGTPDPTPSSISLRMAALGFAIAAAAILVAAPRFAHSAEALATLTGLGNTFVGTWIVGIATSLPELVTTIAAVRLRAIDLAIGNLYGSNCFNMILFVALDVANGGNPVLANGDPDHAISALIAIVLMATGMAAIVFRAGRRFGFMEPSSAAMVLTYVAAVFLLYVRRGES